MKADADRPTIIIDTREQWPYDFDDWPIKVATLDTGDYSVEGLELQIAAERKSMSDLLGCIGNGRKRFQRELQRLRGYRCRVLLIEATVAMFQRGLDWCPGCEGYGQVRVTGGAARPCPTCAGRRTVPWRSQLKPNHITGALDAWGIRYELLIWPGGHRRTCEAWLLPWLMKGVKEIRRTLIACGDVGNAR